MAKDFKFPQAEGDKHQPKETPSSDPSKALDPANVRTTFGTPNEDQ